MFASNLRTSGVAARSAATVRAAWWKSWRARSRPSSPAPPSMTWATPARWARVSTTTTRRTTVARASISRTRRLRATAGSRSLVVLVQLVVKGLEADAEDLGRPCLVVTRLLERVEDQSPFHLVDGGPHGDPDLDRVALRLRGRGGGGRGRRDTAGGRGGGQMREPDEIAGAHDDGALDDVPELPDVAGPPVTTEGEE